MTSSEPNAPLGPSERRRPRPSLAGLLAPLQAAVREDTHGFRLELDHMQPADAFNAWSSVTQHGDPRASSTLLLRLPPAVRRTADAAAPTESTPLAVLAHRLGVDVQEIFSADEILLSDYAARELVAFGGASDLLAVRIEGPIEAADVHAIADALALGQSALEVELRATAVMEMRSGNVLVVYSRERDDVLSFVAESFRHYVAAVRNASVMRIAAPDLGLIHALLERSGRITVRPLETDVYSTSIDVGISTDKRGEIRPADQSMIYDIHSNTWHGE